MKANAGFRTACGWDIAVVAAMVAVVLLGWLSAAGGNYAGAPTPRAPPPMPARLPP